MNDEIEPVSMLEARQRIFGMWQAFDEFQCRKLLSIADDESIVTLENNEN